MTYLALCVVILNEVKNLSESADVRLLCYPVDASLSLSMTKYSDAVDDAIRCHSERSEESPQWQYTINVVYGRL